MVKRFTRFHNGVDYHGVEDRDKTVEGSITKGNKKWVLRGFPKINRISNSYKYGTQVQITIWNKAGSSYEKDRVPYATDWDTIEVFFTSEQWADLVREYFKYIQDIEGKQPQPAP